MMVRAPISQLSIIRNDRWLLSSLTWIPLLLAIMIWAIFSQGIARDLPIGVVNFDDSVMSNTLIRYYDAAPSMQVTEHFSSVEQAKRALITGKIYAYAVIPNKFEQKTLKQLAPQVSVFYNSQMILVGKLIGSAFVQAQGTFNAELSTGFNLMKGNTTLLSAMSNAVPVRTQITPLFNKNSNYAQFLVSAIIPALWQIVIVVSTILILAANYREKGLSSWLSQGTFSAWWRTLAPYSVIFMLQGFVFLCCFFLGFKWPMHGNWLIIITAQIATVIACMIMGSAFFFLTLDPARAMSFAGAFTAPSFAFMGITFPVSDMSHIAHFWRSLLPISHYIEVQVGQASYGQHWIESLKQLSPLLGYVLVAIACIALMKRQLTKTKQRQCDASKEV